MWDVLKMQNYSRDNKIRFRETKTRLAQSSCKEKPCIADFRKRPEILKNR